VIFPTAIFDMAVMIWAGHFVGTKILGWSSIPSLFLGAAISDSATTLLAKTINEMGWGSRRFTKYIFGVTITEDLLCIGVIALLTGLVGSGSLDFRAMSFSIGGLLLFLVGVLVLGILLVPRVVNRVARLKDDEALLLTILAFCFLVSFVAYQLEFSLALGAFLIGVVVAECEPLKRIYEQCVPLRSLFSSIFFVTIGLLVDPAQMLVHWKAITGLTAMVAGLKIVNCTTGSFLTGLDFKNALQTGIGLAQIGEFAYLVALIAVTAGAAENGLYQIAVGVSVLTTVLNPFLLRASDPIADWALRRMPPRVREGLDTYTDWVERLLHTRTSNETARALRIHLTLLALQFVLVAVFFAAAAVLAKIDYTRLSPLLEANKRTWLWGLACLLAVPNAVVLFFRARAFGMEIADALVRGHAAQTSWALSLRRGFGTLCIAGALAALFVEVTLLSGSVMPEQAWARGVVGLTLLAVGVFGWRRFRRLGAESLQTLRNVLTQESRDRLLDESALPVLPAAARQVRLTVGAASAACGRTLREINLRARSGASVIGVERDDVLHVNPAPDERLEAGDVLLLLGNEAQIAEAQTILA
jgi:CPA2 family monovalent cation:H+ antiporter-2